MIEILRPFGNHLQIGFGQKMVAAQIQTYLPKTHTLIEADPLVLEKAKSWLDRHPTIVVIQDIWQSALPSLGVFDTIYCELREIGEGLWPDLIRIRYSDRDLDLFCEGIVRTSAPELFRFLHELAHNGQITHEQLDRMVSKYNLKGAIPTLKKNARQMVACLKTCLEAHMRSGSRFASPLDDFSVAYEDPLFYSISVDPFVEIHECEGGIVAEKFGR